MDALLVGITSTKVNWILDADIRSFFDTVSQEWLIKFVEHRVGDRRIIRLIQKWLKAGVLEDGIVTVSDKGTGQGSVISPLLANLYLHYVLDLWAERWRRREAAGDMIIVRYADDFIVGFEHQSDARRFLDEMRERLQEFALSLHSEKTRLIEFGRLAAANRKRRGLGKPETFTFLGFTFICSKTRRGKFQIKRRSRRPRVRGKVASHQTGIATEHASANSPAGKMVAAGRHRLLQLPRGADKRSGTDRVPLPRHQSLAAHATAAEPERLGRPGSGSSGWPTTGSRNRKSFIRGQRGASPLDTQGGSRMPELGPYGSVRGARSNSRPYRESRRRTVKTTRLTQSGPACGCCGCGAILVPPGQSPTISVVEQSSRCLGENWD